MAEFSWFLIALASSSVLLVVVIILLLFVPRKSIAKAVEAMMRSGKSLDEILAQGATKKRNEREVKLYFLLFTVEDFLDQGYNLHEIENMAADSGWPKDLMDIVISKLK